MLFEPFVNGFDIDDRPDVEEDEADEEEAVDEEEEDVEDDEDMGVSESGGGVGEHDDDIDETSLNYRGIIS